MLDLVELRDYCSLRFALDKELEAADLVAEDEWEGRLWGFVRATPERWAARAASMSDGAVVLLIPAHTKAEWWYRCVVDKASRVILLREAIDKQPYAIVLWDSTSGRHKDDEGPHVTFMEWSKR